MCGLGLVQNFTWGSWHGLPFVCTNSILSCTTMLSGSVVICIKCLFAQQFDLVNCRTIPRHKTQPWHCHSQLTPISVSPQCLTADNSCHQLVYGGHTLGWLLRFPQSCTDHRRQIVVADRKERVKTQTDLQMLACVPVQIGTPLSKVACSTNLYWQRQGKKPCLLKIPSAWSVFELCFAFVFCYAPVVDLVK